MLNSKFGPKTFSVHQNLIAFYSAVNSQTEVLEWAQYQKFPKKKKTQVQIIQTKL